MTVRHMPGVANPADLFTKILSRLVFEKHRRFVLLNLPANTVLRCRWTTDHVACAVAARCDKCAIGVTLGGRSARGENNSLASPPMAQPRKGSSFRHRIRMDTWSGVRAQGGSVAGRV